MTAVLTYLLLADCNKSTVWAMGKELGILEEIQMAEPTDGLWSDGRTDTVSIRNEL